LFEFSKFFKKRFRPVYPTLATILYANTFFTADPLDNRYLYVSSPVEFPESGESSFAKTEIPANTNYALYSGHVLEKEKHHSEFLKWKNENNYSDDHHEIMLAKKYL
jgi:hypothetical protein